MYYSSWSQLLVTLTLGVYHVAFTSFEKGWACDGWLGSLQFAGAAEMMLLCDGLKCDEAFHSFCLAIPLQIIPDGDWLCPMCIHQGSTAAGTSKLSKKKLSSELFPPTKRIEEILGSFSQWIWLFDIFKGKESAVSHKMELSFSPTWYLGMDDACHVEFSPLLHHSQYCWDALLLHSKILLECYRCRMVSNFEESNVCRLMA